MAFEEKELKKFSSAGRTIAAAMGASVEQWARAEAGVILKTWVGRTNAAKEKAVTRSAIVRAYRLARRVVGFGNDKRKGTVGPGEAGINLGFRGQDGKVYYRTRKRGLEGGRKGFQDVYGPGFTKGKHIASNDWPKVNTMVQIYRREVKDMIKAAKKAIGLSRQSVIQIADDLKIPLESVPGTRTSIAAIKKGREALASDGRAYKNGYGEQSRLSQEFSLTLINRYPKAGVIGMDRTLQVIIAGRLGFFQKNLEKGVFLSAERAARAYPYLKVLRDAA